MVCVLFATSSWVLKKFFMVYNYINNINIFLENQFRTSFSCFLFFFSFFYWKREFSFIQWIYHKLYFIFLAYVKTSLKFILVVFLLLFLLCKIDEQLGSYCFSSFPKQSKAWQNKLFRSFNKRKSHSFAKKIQNNWYLSNYRVWSFQFFLIKYKAHFQIAKLKK